MVKWLYRYEVKGIQRWVLATNTLREVAGASNLIEGLPRRLKSVLTEVDAAAVRYVEAAGGATVGLTSDDALRALAEHWPLIVARRLPGAELVQAWVPATEDSRRDLSELMKRLVEARSLRAAELPEAGPHVERAGRTGRPAVDVERPIGAPPRAAEDESERVRSDASSKLKLEAYESGGDAGSLATRLVTAEDLSTKLLPITDHEDFGEEQVALVHIDANGMGQLIASERWSPDVYGEFSKDLGAATLAAARAFWRALCEAHHARNRRCEEEGRRPLQKLQARPIVLGGDDFTVLCLAQDALTATRAYLETLEAVSGWIGRFSGSVEGALAKVTACAGIAFVKSETPTIKASRLAEDLCSLAKGRLRHLAPRMPSGVAFYRVTTSDVPDRAAMLETLRTAVSAESPSTAEERASGFFYAPWVLGAASGFASLDQLTDLRRAFGGLPRGPLREWARLVKFDPLAAHRQWARVKEVAGDRRTWLPFETALARSGVAADGPRSGFDSAGRSPMLDVLTLAMVGAPVDQCADGRFTR